MKIAVVGGSGFIGSHLVEGLLKEGHIVRVIDKEKPFQNKVKHDCVDILNYPLLEKSLNDVEVIYHLAAHKDANAGANQPLNFFQTNVNGTLNVLEAARKQAIKRVIFASSVWVYSAASGERVSEETPLEILKANHPYTLSKILSEAYIRKYHELFGLDYTILRYGVTYGARAKLHGLVPLFIQKAIKNEPVVIFGNGKQKRSLIYVRDIAAGNIAALQDAAKNKTYNIDGNKSVSVNQFLEVLEKVIGKKINVNYQQARQDDYPGKQVDIEKARKELHWMPETGLEEGIKKYLHSLSS